ncbi:MAG TPA: inorganic phosphate transporter [Abditibacteriaceae bacterium]
MIIFLLFLMALLAFANGANDNCKGVATLVGYGAAKPRHALLWATATTALGALVSFWAASGLVKSFSTGLFIEGTKLNSAFYAAVLIGAFGWVILATFTGFPVSTTHAITGALTGAGLVAFGNAHFEWAFLGARFALPLALSPLLSLALVYILSWPILFIVSRWANRCACVTSESRVMPQANGVAAMESAHLSVMVDNEAACAGKENLAAVTTSGTANAYHWLTAGLVGFARGWNDAPKIAALGLVAFAGTSLQASGMLTCFVIVTVAMALGGLIAGRKVLETLSRKITPLPLAESMTASTTTALLVSLASWQGMPVSTTHVSTGAIIGAGLKHNAKGVHWNKVREILLSWLLTLPFAALIAAGAQLLLGLQ